VLLVRPTDARRSTAPRARVLAAVAVAFGVGLALGGHPPDAGPGGHDAGPDGAPGALEARGVEAGEGSPLQQPTRGWGLLTFGPAPPPPWGPGPPTAEPTSPASGTGEPPRGPGDATPEPEDTAPPPDVVATAPEGFRILAGAASAGAGDRHTFTVEVEDGLDGDAGELVETIHSALLDDESSWARDHELVQVADPGAADIRVVLATPATVDEWCGAVGLDTGGDSSCWDGERAMLNGDRWRHGVDHVDDLETYRAYLVNHEVGHGLGHSHVDCPEVGALAPVMMQQTLGLGGCHPNPWPYP
jgi:hypothetical protein